MNNLIRSFAARMTVTSLILATGCYAQSARPKAVIASSEYKLELDIEPARHAIYVRGQWHIPAFEKRNPPDEWLHFQITPYAKNLLFGFHPGQIHDRPACHQDGGDLTCTLPISSASRRLYFSYEFEAADAPQLRVTENQTFAGGNGELWYPQTSFAQRDSGEIKCAVPSGWHCFATGDRTTLLRGKGKTIFVTKVSTPSKFAFAAAAFHVIDAGRFHLLTLKARPNDSEGTKQGSEVLAALEREYGMLPYSQFTLVEIQFGGKVLGTSEFGAIFADSSQFDKAFDLSYWGHEIAHQWWGDLIRTQVGTPGRMLMSEGIAQYSAVRVVDELQGAQASARFRKEGILNHQQSIDGYVEMVDQNKDSPLATTVPKGQDEILLMHRLANSKGMLVFWMLSNELGKERFNTILRGFIRDHANAPTSWSEFERFVSKAAEPKNLDWFFRQWTEDRGLPHLQLDWSQNADSLEVYVKQCGATYRLEDLPIRIDFGGPTSASAWRTLTVSDSDETLHLRIPEKILSIELDPFHQFLWSLGCSASTESKPSTSQRND